MPLLQVVHSSLTAPESRPSKPRMLSMNRKHCQGLKYYRRVRKMPPFSTDDYHKLLQKIAVPEIKIHRLEVNMEVNGQYGNETTLPMSQNSEKEQANRELISTTKKQEPGANGSKSSLELSWCKAKVRQIASHRCGKMVNRQNPAPGDS